MSLLNDLKDELYRQTFKIHPDVDPDPNPIKVETEPIQINPLEPNNGKERKKPWQAPMIYTSIDEFEADKNNIVANLSANDPNIKYSSKKAMHNYRNLIRNVGDLYRDYELAL